MVFCDPDGWRVYLDQLAQLDVDTYAPGHGPLGTQDDIALQRRYLDVMHDLIASSIRNGVPVDDVVAEQLPAPFDTWQRANWGRWEANVRAMYERSVQS